MDDEILPPSATTPRQEDRVIQTGFLMRHHVQKRGGEQRVAVVN
jgi:hypothetical protein